MNKLPPVKNKPGEHQSLTRQRDKANKVETTD